MRNYLSIGAAPAEESCAQVGSDKYSVKARKECSVFIAQIRRQFGKEPEGARLTIKSFSHDFDSYYEVCCYYDDAVEASVEYAFNVENNTPANWDDEAKKELGEFYFEITDRNY